MSGGDTAIGRRLAGLALAAALVAAACSGDGDDSSASTTTSTSDSTAPTGSAPDGAPTPATSDGSAPDDSTAPGGEAVTFGFIRPAPGLLLELSSAQLAALRLAVADITAAGGVLGSPAEIVVADEPLTGDVGVAIAQLAEQGVDVVLGPVSSSAARSALAPLAALGAVACSASATAPDLAGAGDDLFFRTPISDAVTVEVVADHLTARREARDDPDAPYRVSIAARSDDYGIQVGNTLAAALVVRGIDATVVGYHPRRVVFTDDATRIASDAPDAVVLASFSEGGRLLAALTGAGVPAASIVGLGGSFDPRLAQRAMPGDPAAADGFEVIGSTGGRAFLERLLEEPDTAQLAYGAQMYDCAILTALAVHAADSPDPARFGPLLREVSTGGRACSTYADCIASLDAGDDIDYEGVSGGIEFDEHGDVGEARFTVARFAGGALEEISSTDVDLAEQRQAEALAQAIFVTRLQQVLTALGFYDGPIDGVLTDEVSTAIGLLQADLGVPVTGTFDEATDAALRERHGAIATALGEAVAGIQLLLTELGFYDGPIDGTMSRATIDAIRALQRELGVPETGLLDAATLRAAYLRGASTTDPDPAEPPTTASPPTEPPTTRPPVPEPPVTAPPPTDPPATPPPVTEPSPTQPSPPDPDPSPDPDDDTLLDVLRGDARFSTLVELVGTAGFVADLGALGQLTVLAPTNDAFDALGPDALEALREDPERLEELVTFHLAEGELTFEELASLDELRTVHGETITVATDADDTIRLDAATAIPPALAASNGVVVPIDQVLVIPDR